MEDGRFVWPTNCVGYLKSEIDNVNNSLGVDKSVLKNYGNGGRPYSSSYRPELDVTEELGEELTNRYHKIIGVMRWSIELGRIDFLTWVICLYQHLCSPIERNQDGIYCIFRYQQKNVVNNPGKITYDPMYDPIDENYFDVAGIYLDECNFFTLNFRKESQGILRGTWQVCCNKRLCG